MAVGKKNGIDSYSNIAAVYVTESAANTQTSAKFQFPFSIMDKMALLINRIEYWFEGLSSFNGADDRSIMALGAAAAIVNLNLQSDPLIIDSTRIMRMDYGVAASGFLVGQPFIKDFATLPGGGILVAPNPLYAIIQSTGAAAALAGTVKLFYTYMELATEDYWQLVESRRVITS
jgi:hypothetical protein